MLGRMYFTEVFGYQILVRNAIKSKFIYNCQKIAFDEED